MRRVLCGPIPCRCGGPPAGSAGLDWLVREGLDVGRLTHPGLAPKRLTLPREAEEVTGKFNLRCNRCFELMPVFAILRARGGGGGGGGVELPPPRGGAAARASSEAPAAVPAKG